GEFLLTKSYFSSEKSPLPTSPSPHHPPNPRQFLTENETALPFQAGSGGNLIKQSSNLSKVKKRLIM
ncbi:MAG: hypothetical protein VKK42_00670, partial [Lyngbya sp.]|nr:hypothetical protein [Lyngbya sp.]